MLERIIKIENIKQWQHKGGLNQSFDILNLIYGRNGSGKSTLCKLFESINQNDKLSIQALQPIESQDKQVLQLRVDSKNITLDSLQSPFIFQIFNQEFIDNNLYISNSKDRKQLTNYYDFSLGNVSVVKEKQIDQIKTENEGLTSNITTITNRLLSKFNFKPITKIRAISVIEKADDELEQLKSKIQDIKSVEHFKKRKSLVLLNLDKPHLYTDVFNINIEALSKDAEEKVSKHISNNLKDRDQFWLETGVKLVSDSNNCPFCAQPLSSSPIFHLYQEFINESYLDASSNFQVASDEFWLSVSDIGVKIEELETRVKINKDIIREWSDKIDEIHLDFDFSKLDRISTNLLLECSRLIKIKEKDLLFKVDLTKFTEIFNQVFDGLDFTDYNFAVNEFNSAIKTFIDQLEKDTTQSIKLRIDQIEESKLRFTYDVSNDLEKLNVSEELKKVNTKKIRELRDQIAEEQEESIRKHKDSINEILHTFNSMIRLKELEKDNRGKGGATRLNYIITFINSELSILDEDQHQHIFENILSLGDRSALALAFFLSKFSKVNNDNSIIILDDPMSSLDSHRKETTIIQIEKLINNNYQTFVFSHDPFFLSDIHKHAVLSQKTKCFEIESSYKDLNPLKIDSSKYISSKMIDRDNYDSYVLHSYHKEYNKLHDFVINGTENNKVEIARSIRPILEAYLRFLYPKQFIKGIWLGQMIKMIREETDEESILYDKNQKINIISQINEYSSTYHHSEDFDTKIQSLDFSTVQYYAKSTLLFITGL